MSKNKILLSIIVPLYNEENTILKVLKKLSKLKETYDNIDTKNAVWMWEDYISFTLNWSIKGNIDRAFNNNRGAIFLAEKQIKRKKRKRAELSFQRRLERKKIKDDRKKNLLPPAPP